jgi:hypothetical protein
MYQGQNVHRPNLRRSRGLKTGEEQKALFRRGAHTYIFLSDRTNYKARHHWKNFVSAFVKYVNR